MYVEHFIKYKGEYLYNYMLYVPKYYKVFKQLNIYLKEFIKLGQHKSE